MGFAVTLVVNGHMELVAACADGGAAANLAGSLLAFWLGWWGQEHVVRQLIRTYGKVQAYNRKIWTWPILGSIITASRSRSSRACCR